MKSHFLIVFFLIVVACPAAARGNQNNCRLTNAYVFKFAMEFIKKGIEKYPDRTPNGYQIELGEHNPTNWFVKIQPVPALPESGVVLRFSCGLAKKPKVEVFSSAIPPPPK